MSKPEIQGHCDPQYSALKDAFAENFAAAEEIGACLALIQDGDLVVDIWAGHSDRKGDRVWQADTLVNVFSSGKVVAATLILMLVDRGLLALDAPVADYWPEFAANGKEAVTVRDALTHRACIPGFAEQQPWDACHDWDRVVELTAREKPWFEPRTLCYHPQTFGFIMGELVRRVTGQNIHTFGQAELFEPLGADFHFQLDPKDFDRIAALIDDDPLPFEDDSIAARTIGSFADPPDDVKIWALPERLSAILPGASNFANARSMAKLGSVIALKGTVAGRRYLSPELVEEACREQVRAEDPTLGDLRLGLTFGLDGPGFRAPTPSCVHWGGYGGSWSVMNPATGTAAAYAMNKCHFEEEVLKDPRQDRLWGALTGILDRLA
jgi:CubicO group peptidase (beta-lactamase class C family)